MFLIKKVTGYVMKKVLVIATSFFLAGCASTTILPQGNGRYSLVSTSASESAAITDAKKKATEECQKQNKHLVVLKHHSKYQGIDKSEKAVINIAGALLTGTSSSANSSDDYKVTMTFSCR